jgi:hypothetical protein
MESSTGELVVVSKVRPHMNDVAYVSFGKEQKLYSGDKRMIRSGSAFDIAPGF